MPTFATFNVNSINARLPILVDWLREAAPDVVLLQETKCVDAAFPHFEIQAQGYEALTHGQKSYNGVAVLAKGGPVREVRRGLPGDEGDDQARYLEADVFGCRVASIYLPNGNPLGTDKFAYKLRWFERLRAHAALLLEEGVPLILGGDYNVIPEPLDCFDPKVWENDALYRPESRRAYRALLHLGLTDALRALHPTERLYSFWDYQKRSLQLDQGIRIDHMLLSARAADRLEAAWVDKEPRRRPKASDHTPVLVRLREV